MSGMMLPLVKALTPRLQADCAGLEKGIAPILEKVTPLTADLLRWWFQQDCCDTRRVNFHEGQRQAILHAIYAHEILQPETLVDLYQKLAAEDLLTARRLEQVLQSGHPKYCLKMATGTGKTWVLQALLYWQLLNAAHSPQDKRFTRNFLIVAPGLIVYQRLLDAFLGKERQGQRDFAMSDLARFNGILIDEAQDLPSSAAFRHRFGTLVSAYQLIGYDPGIDYGFIEINRKLRKEHPEIVASVIRRVGDLGAVAAWDERAQLLHLNNELRVSIVLCRHLVTSGGSSRWIIRLDEGLKPDITVAVRMDATNEGVRDYYLLPAIDMTWENLRVAEENGVYLDAYRFETLDYFIGMAERIKLEEAA
jgi:hypothetical protein